MKYIKVVTAILLSLLLSAPALGAERLPWGKFSEAAQDAVGASMAACATSTEFVTIFVATLEKDGKGYVYLYEEGGRIIWLYYPSNEQGTWPTKYAVSRVDLKTPGAHDIIPEVNWVSPVPKDLNLCALLLGEEDA